MDIEDPIGTIAARFVERASALNLKGMGRDRAAMEYFVGAAVGAELAGNTRLHDWIARVAVMIVSVRGYRGVLDLAKGETQVTIIPADKNETAT